MDYQTFVAIRSFIEAVALAAYGAEPILLTVEQWQAVRPVLANAQLTLTFNKEGLPSTPQLSYKDQREPKDLLQAAREFVAQLKAADSES